MKNILRSFLVFLFDLVAVIGAWIASFLIRFNFDELSLYLSSLLISLPILIIIQAIACRWVGLYRGMWVFASLPDLKRVLRAVGTSSFVLVIMVALYRANPPIPRSLLILYPLLLLLFMGGGRVAWRMWKEHMLYGNLIAEGKPVIVVGAGTGAAMLVRELERSPDWQVVALIDDDRNKWGLEINGHPVVGPLSNLVQVLQDYKAKHAILAMPSASVQIRRKVTNQAISIGAQVFTVPGIEELMSGRVAIDAMRPIRIEDLLGRESVLIDTEHIESILFKQTVFVTGAGGSIGSELCRQIAQFTPSRLILLESSEFTLYTIEQWFTQFYPKLTVVPLIGDVKDSVRLNEIFEFWQPQIIFHAAAYKHVPLMEVGNAWQAVRNNVLGTLKLAECACRYNALRFVLISTDKAVNPANVMGATKRLAEMICEVFHNNKGLTQFSIVRFGNVLGSTGSVIPKFQQQIATGGPITVTDPEVNRYFMSISEAAQLVLQAAAMGHGGEIFVLDMGEPVKIVDLARHMISLSGYTEKQIRIEFTGLRPGEKLFEELLTDTEQTCHTPHPKLRIARSRLVPENFLVELSAWLHQTHSVSDKEVRRYLQRWVPEYSPMIE